MRLTPELVSIPLISIALLLGACGPSGEETPDTPDDQDQGQTTPAEDMTTSEPDDMGTSTPDQGMATEDMSAPTEDMGTPEEDMATPPEDMGTPMMGDVPTDGDALFTWLQAGSYLEFQAESAVHQSTGPHGRVRTFFNQTLVDSYNAGNTNHPVGSAAIKELHDANGLDGWAVEVKVADTGSGGDDWYWYEIFSTTSNANPVADGTGVGLCANCHSGGTDYVLTPWPLQ